MMDHDKISLEEAHHNYLSNRFKPLNKNEDEAFDFRTIADFILYGGDYNGTPYTTMDWDIFDEEMTDSLE